MSAVHGQTHTMVDERINGVVSEMINEARRVRARSITFHYEVYQTDTVVSVVIHATVSSVISRTLVRSVNFDFWGNILTVNEAMGLDAISLAERILSDKIRRDPARYYAALSASLHNQAFFITHQGLVLVFDEFQLSTTRSGIETISLLYDNIREAVVNSDQHHRSQDGYNLLMIPLRFVLEDQLRYRVDYFQEYHGPEEDGMRVDVWRNNHLVIFMRPGINEYHVMGMMQRSLEAAPEIINGSVYVPITFFDQILPLTTYSIDSFGTITFLSYVG